MEDEQHDRVKKLAFLKWELLANESAKEKGMITAAMYEFARDALKKDIAALELLCYNGNCTGGGNNGIKVRTAMP